MTKREKKELIEEYSKGAVEAYISIMGEEYATKEGFEEDYQGEWDTDEEFVQQLLEDCGDIPRDMPTYIHIDWERTARYIMYDYATENNYYFRNT